MNMAGMGTGYATVPTSHDTVEKVVTFLNTTQMVRSAALVGIFIFGVMKRQLWFGVDMVVTGLASLVLILAPQLLLDFQISRQALDGVDIQMARMLGCIFLGNAVLWFLATKYTKDPETVHPALLLTRVITNGILAIAIIDVQLFTKAWSNEHLTFGLVGVILWLVGNLVHLVNGGYNGGHLQRQRPINSFLLRDFAISVFLGFALFGFPRWFLRNFTLVRTLDGAHEHLTRVVGAAIFGTGLYGFQAVGFQDDRDKENHFIQRLVSNSALMLSTLYAQVFYYREWNIVNNWAVQFFLVLWTIHAYLGWKADPFQVRYAGGNRTKVVRERERITTRSPVGGLRGGLVADYDERED